MINLYINLVYIIRHHDIRLEIISSNSHVFITECSTISYSQMYWEKYVTFFLYSSESQVTFKYWFWDYLFPDNRLLHSDKSIKIKLNKINNIKISGELKGKKSNNSESSWAELFNMFLCCFGFIW